MNPKITPINFYPKRTLISACNISLDLTEQSTKRLVLLLNRP